MLFCGEPQHTLWRHRWQHKTDMKFVEKKKKIDRIYARMYTETHDALSKLNVVFYSKFQIITVVFSYLVSVIKNNNR